jgi:hypothetical protein
VLGRNISLSQGDELNRRGNTQRLTAAETRGEARANLAPRFRLARGQLGTPFGRGWRTLSRRLRLGAAHALPPGAGAAWPSVPDPFRAAFARDSSEGSRTFHASPTQLISLIT